MPFSAEPEPGDSPMSEPLNSEAPYKKLDDFLAGLSRDEISYICDAATAILDNEDPAPDDGQPSEQQEQADFARDDMMEPNYLEE